MATNSSLSRYPQSRVERLTWIKPQLTGVSKSLNSHVVAYSSFDSHGQLALDKSLLSQPRRSKMFHLRMNKALISVVILLVVFAVGCKRKGGTNSSNTDDGRSASSGASTNPSQARALLEKGKLLYRDDQDSEASEAFKQAISLDPAFAEAHFRLGLAYEALNKAQEADDEYKKAVEGYKKYFENDQNDSDAVALSWRSPSV